MKKKHPVFHISLLLGAWTLDKWLLVDILPRQQCKKDSAGSQLKECELNFNFFLASEVQQQLRTALEDPFISVIL